MPPDDRSRLYLEDLGVGQEFLSAEHRLDAGQIVAFASDFDPQPFHIDPEGAKDSFFQGLAASGWHTAAITMKLIVSSLPVAGGVIGAGGTIAWPRPTRPDDVLRTRSRIVEITPSRSRPDRGMVQTHTLTLNQHDAVLQELTANLVVFRRKA